VSRVPVSGCRRLAVSRCPGIPVGNRARGAGLSGRAAKVGGSANDGFDGQCVWTKPSGASAPSLARAMPERVEMAGVLRQLQRTAHRSEVRLDSVTPQAAAAQSGYSAVPKRDNLFGGGNYDAEDFDDYNVLQRDLQVEAQFGANDGRQLATELTTRGLDVAARSRREMKNVSSVNAWNRFGLPVRPIQTNWKSSWC